MLDPKLIRSDLASVAEQLKKRNFNLDVNALEQLEQKRKVCQIQTEELQQLRNTRSKSIGQA
jgi:seryl-tRNA synthetase